jgi:uncharacterized protein
MIRSGEIQKKANNLGVRDQQIEKDYILSWILQGISQHEELSSAMAFKGGTVLKKVYFEDYRFSEDLDFTLLDEAVDSGTILDWFTEVFGFVKQAANIPLTIIDDNEHADGGINFYISYTGPLGGTGANKKVKVDISRSEKLVSKPELKDVILGYSDQENHELLCYTLDEILVEKLRSVMQRVQARDFYDIWYLAEIEGMDADFIQPEFKTKCEQKGLDPRGFHSKLEDRIPLYRGRWQSSIATQIRDLPDFEKVLREVNRKLKDFSVR